MTLVRRVARKISCAVVRYASPGCKEWAEGLAREAEFIPSDWAALWWALGSIRVLLNRREAPLRSLTDVAERARRFSEVQGKGQISHWLPLLFAFDYLLRLTNSGGRVERLGCWLVGIGGFFLGVAGLVLWRQRFLPPLSQEPAAWATYYKMELKRLRDNSRSALTKASTVAVLLYSTGMALAQKGGVRAHPLPTGFLTLMVLLISPALFRERATSILDFQIAEVDAVLGETRSVD